MNYVDVLVLIIIGLTVFEGYKKGLIKMAFETVGVIVAFFISKQTSYIITDALLEHTKLYSTLVKFFEGKSGWLTKLFESGRTDVIHNFTEVLKLPQEMKMLFVDSVKNNSVYTTEVLLDKVSMFVVKSIGFLVMFLIAYAVLLAIVSIINTIVKLPLLNMSNKVAGAALGLAKGVLILYIGFAVISPMIAFIPDDKVANSIMESKSGKIFYEKNIILNYLSYKGFYE